MLFYLSVFRHIQSNEEAAEYGEVFAKEQQTSIDSSCVRECTWYVRVKLGDN